ncbi:hydrogen cyanide synthase [Pseudoalteromonas citrea]|uniref:Hydrogen cyanide synthase n=1 Tax=Pseudoalteromonas citrea TaxID=43655 RepID=A0A5S3XT95_9GAMM|nr:MULTISPECIES: FAD-dependent oxidoreductase [Pseudoalteromonas]RJE76541.1 hydrogen cyanide synthase [Pseudoalteromonas sp. MSK9-3]TMP45046.1 hydrogen cyanide synthase [Pseudoalteromonas citrea]TMP61572.1 hydrogen cyanide synthase [Pseudoalteromonas citrea]
MKKFDVVIAGGGVIGAACAYFLSRDTQLKVALIDIKKPGNASRASAGGLWAIGESVGLGCGVIFFKTLSKLQSESKGKDIPVMRPHQLPDCFFEFALASNAMYPALHKELLEQHGVDFKFERTGLKFIMYNQDDRIYADQITSGIPHLADQVRWLDAQQLKEEEPYITDDAIGAIDFICDHQVNPYRLVDAYLEGARQNGVELVLNSEVSKVLREGNRVTGVATQEDTYYCDTLINAAGAWADTLFNKATGLNMPVYPVKGQIVLSERLPKVLNGCVSTSDCYIAQKDNGEILIGSSTEEKGFDTTNSLDKITELSQGALKCLPILKDSNIKRCWAGLRPGTPDELPILGHVPGIKGYINACGHFRTGIVTSAITGKLITELVTGQETSLDLTPFSVTRFFTQE